MARKTYSPLTREAVLCAMALKHLHDIQTQLELADPENPLVMANKCAIDQMHHALQKTAEKRNFDPTEIAVVLGGPGGDK